MVYTYYIQYNESKTFIEICTDLYLHRYMYVYGCILV